MSFEFTRNGVVFRFHTEVGDGEARCVLEEQQQPDQPMEPEEE